MAIVVGNKTTNVKTPAGTQMTFNHTQDSGDNRLLVIAISMNRVNNTTTVKYNGINMTQRLKYKGSVILQTARSKRKQDYNEAKLNFKFIKEKLKNND